MILHRCFFSIELQRIPYEDPYRYDKSNESRSFPAKVLLFRNDRPRAVAEESNFSACSLPCGFHLGLVISDNRAINQNHLDQDRLTGDSRDRRPMEILRLDDVARETPR